MTSDDVNNSPTSQKAPDKAKVTLSSSKASKKERHMQLADELSRFLDRNNERTDQEVMLLKRDLREALEGTDAELDAFLARISAEAYLLDKSERHLTHKLHELRNMLQRREAMLTKLESDLEAAELRRAATASAEVKLTVDKLVAIGFALPDDIERLVEREAFELNKEMIAQRSEHAKAVAELRIAHVQREHALVLRWEQTRTQWRALRHAQALRVYEQEMHSDALHHPQDRRELLQSYRAQQTRRREKHLVPLIQRVLSLSYESLSTELVAELQQAMQRGNEDELSAIQQLYDSLTSLRHNTAAQCRERVEALRKELHVYGALKIMPNLSLFARKIEETLNSAANAELWRVGGGLKSDLQSLVEECDSEDVVYERVLSSMSEKLSLIESGFPLKKVLEERGRLAMLEKVRQLVSKTRSAPRHEIPDVLKALLSELDELRRLETLLPPLFVSSITTLSEEMREELVALEKRVIATQKAAQTLSLAATSLLDSTGTNNNSNSEQTQAKTMKTANKTVLATQTLSRTKGKAGATLNTKRDLSLSLSTGTGTVAPQTHTVPAVHIDPLRLKAWHRKLALLCFASELSTDTQTLFEALHACVREQRECNALVDAVVEERSSALLQRMDRTYKKLVDRLTSYLESNANFLFVQTTNLADALRKIAQCVEAHKQAQKTIDDRSADELWDLREESRLKLEDLEQLYKEKCVCIRQSTKQSEIDAHFAEVLAVLESIAQHYREYHADSCFAADKYSLSLINEFRECVCALAPRLFLFPQESHPIEQEYERLFESTTRFNRKFFEKNALAAGFPRVSFADKHSAMLKERAENGFYAESDTATESNVRVYVSPLGDRSPDTIGGYGGRYDELDSTEAVYAYFASENKFKSKQELESEGKSEKEPQSNGEQQEKKNENDAKGDEDFSVPVTEKPVFEAHPQCAFLRADSSVLPLTSDEEWHQMHADDREEYEIALAKSFVRLPEGTLVPAAPAVPEKKGGKAPPAPVIDNSGTVLALSEEDQEKYRRSLKIVAEAKQRWREQSSPQWIRDNAPCDERGEPWALPTRITAEELQKMLQALRGTLVVALERESFKKILTVSAEMQRRKDELTDELEDRVRNHWPRRGRVETEIKQPREAELLGHKDKTWRLIQMIQRKMIDLQGKFEAAMESGEHACEQYMLEIDDMKAQLSGDFKNLAALQAIDVRARGVTIDFQSDCSKRIESLTAHYSVDIEAVSVFAQDFRRICPLQSAENQSGYSESELQEIQVLIDGQCAEMRTLAGDWRERVSSLASRQQSTQKSYEALVVKYNEAVQHVAMAEGLGQKYGAPRRRAQERIRTEISRDERRAGKIDSFLAEMEFFANEAQLLPLRDVVRPTTANMDGDNSSPSEKSGKTPSETQRETQRELKTLKNNETSSSNPLLESCVHFNKLHFLWAVVRTTREALLQRVNFLQVIGSDENCSEFLSRNVSEFAWIDETRIVDTFLTPTSTPSPFSLQRELSAEDDSPLGTQQQPQTASAPATIMAVFEDIDKQCRLETKQLYESEGLAHVLSSSGGGVPASLQEWLAEARERVLGRHGYREKAWKKLWSQLQRLDALFVRMRNLSEQGREDYLSSAADVTATMGERESEESAKTISQKNLRTSHSAKTSREKEKTMGESSLTQTNTRSHSHSPPKELIKPMTISIQGAALQSFLFSFLLLAKREWAEQQIYFSKLLKVWALSRDKHERMLRPRLGSPDKAQELQDLDAKERARSQDMVEGVRKFRSALVRNQVGRFRFFVEDVARLSKSWLLMLDNTLRQELLQIPPDTEIPKKHMTLKKLRKAQRIREEVARGGADISQRRLWPGIDFSTEMLSVVRTHEDLVVDLGQDPKDVTGGLADAAPAPVVDAKDTKKGAKEVKKSDKSSKGGDRPVSAAPATPPSLLPSLWLQRVKETSAMEGLVSSAHRIVLEERSGAIDGYLQYLDATLREVREEYEAVLQQEQSWIERWARQVDMLKQGKV